MAAYVRLSGVMQCALVMCGKLHKTCYTLHVDTTVQPATMEANIVEVPAASYCWKTAARKQGTSKKNVTLTRSLTHALSQPDVVPCAF